METAQAEARSALTGWVLAIIRATQAAGVDVAPILAEIGLDTERLQGGHSRYSQQQVSELWRRAVAATGDPVFSLKVAAEVRPATFHVVGYAMSCSATPLRALQRFARYCRLISDSAAATLTEAGESVTLELLFDTGGAPPIFQTVDTVVAGLVAFLRWICHNELSPIEVRLRHASPGDDRAQQDFFRSPIRYGAAQDCIVFCKADLFQPILAADEELASLLETAANGYLTKRMAGRFAVRVRDVLIAQLPDGEPSKRKVAGMLNMTQRTLLRRLKDEGTTFTDVVQQLREELAFRYLRDEDKSIGEIAYLLGFSDENTFSRAFKRWTGRRPAAVRRRPDGEKPRQKTLAAAE
jgi:AraC-like DNA-binding protein